MKIHFKLTVAFLKMVKNGPNCYFRGSLMVLKRGTDVQMDRQTSSHHKPATDGINAQQKCKGLWFLFTPLWCVSGTCAWLLSETGELLLLPSLHTGSKWTFIRNGSCLWERTHTNWQILHCTLHSNWCQLFQTEPAAVLTVSNLGLQGTPKHRAEHKVQRERERDCYHPVTHQQHSATVQAAS